MSKFIETEGRTGVTRGRREGGGELVFNEGSFYWQ